MSAVVESLPLSAVATARAALEAVQAELGHLDRRIADYQRELDERELARRSHQVADTQAIVAGRARPKALKLSASDAEVALPVLRAERVKLAERVDVCQGELRRALVADVQRRRDEAIAAFGAAATQVIAAWRDLVGTQLLLEQAGVRSSPLPPALYSEFSIPAVGRMKPICENHWAHFLASHQLDQGEGRRAAIAARAEIEHNISIRLPW